MSDNKNLRRYDIDWLRVITIGLLIIYHTAIVFQPWGLMIGFMTNEEKWESLWIPMTMLNVWRIPLLFFIAGIGVYFSFENRTWQQLLKERVLRIGVPFIFGSLVIVPIFMYIMQQYYSWKLQYLPHTGHLWFLGNILIYVLFSLPFIVALKKINGSQFSRRLKKIIANPLFLLLVIVCFVGETFLVKPLIYEMYAMTWHGFFLGMMAFLFGYLFGYSGEPFWDTLRRHKCIFMIGAIVLYISRITKVIVLTSQLHLPIETCFWIFSMFGFARQYLNRPHRHLPYLSRAAYPIYILHMIFIGVGSSFLLPLDIAVEVKFITLVVFTFLASLGSYHLIKIIPWVRLLFGLENK